jgi:hypothetical protein
MFTALIFFVVAVRGNSAVCVDVVFLCRKECAMQEQRHAKWCSLVTLVVCWLLDFLAIQTGSMLYGARVISQLRCVWKLSTAPLEFSSLTMIMTLI